MGKHPIGTDGSRVKDDNDKLDRQGQKEKPEKGSEGT